MTTTIRTTPDVDTRTASLADLLAERQEAPEAPRRRFQVISLETDPADELPDSALRSLVSDQELRDRDPLHALGFRRASEQLGHLLSLALPKVERAEDGRYALDVIERLDPATVELLLAARKAAGPYQANLGIEPVIAYAADHPVIVVAFQRVEAGKYGATTTRWFPIAVQVPSGAYFLDDLEGTLRMVLRERLRRQIAAARQELNALNLDALVAKLAKDGHGDYCGAWRMLAPESDAR